MEDFDHNSLDALFARVKRLHHHRVVALLEELELYYGQPPVLFALWRTDGCTQSELAKSLRLTPATITATLKRMEKANWITRKADPQDSRVSRVYLTDQGKSVRIPVEKKLSQLEQETFKGFTDVEKALLRRFFMQMEENLNQFN